MAISLPTLSLSSTPKLFSPFSSSSSFSSANSSLLVNPGSVIFVPRYTTTRLAPTQSRTINGRRKGFFCNALFGLGMPELVVIAGVAALVFGPKKLPEVGKSIGKTVKSFQQAAKEFESELKKDPEDLSETTEVKPSAVGEDKKTDNKVSATSES